MYMFKRTSQKKIVLFKRRKKKLKLYFLEKNFKSMNMKKKIYICVKNRLFLEMFYYRFILRRFRKMCKKKRFRMLFFYKPNHAFFKKSTNSRMGKGKGKLTRVFFKTSCARPIIILSNCSMARWSKFYKILKNSISHDIFFYKNFI